MSRAFKYELRRLFHSKLLIGFLIAQALILALALFCNLYNVVRDGLDYTCVKVIEGMFNINLINTLLAIFVALYVSEDYSNGALKNVISRGVKRGSLYFCKLLMVITFVIILYAMSYLIAFVTGYILFDLGTFTRSLLEDAIVRILISIAFACLYFAITATFKKTSASVTLCIILPLVIYLLLVIGQEFILEYVESFKYTIYNYWLYALDDSIMITFTNFTTKTKCIISAIYIVCFTLIGLFASRKHEVR